MSPDDHDLDDEIRDHLAVSIKERIERGEDPESARLAALKEFGNVALTRESIRAVWRPRWVDAAGARGRDVRFAFRSLIRSKGLTATVVVTLALGVGANAAIFSVVRGVLLRPLVNRDEDRLIYIRQSAPGIGVENMTSRCPSSASSNRGSPPSARSVISRRSTSRSSATASPAWSKPASSTPRSSTSWAFGPCSDVC